MMQGGTPPESCGASNTATQSQVRDCPPLRPPSIDWLTVAQVHTTAPLVGSSLLLFIDPATGVVDSQAMRGLTHEGSYDSRLMVRSDGRRVEVSGNPSRFGRPDNVWGRTSIDECIELYNGVLRSLGLPEFFLDDRTHVSQLQGYGHGGRSARNPLRDLDLSGASVPEWMQDETRGQSQALPGFVRDEVNAALASESRRGGVSAVAEHGCRIKRVDLCEVYEVGNIEDARQSLRAMSSVSHSGKPGFLYPDANTISWGQGSRFVYFKYYLKGPEMRKHSDQSDPYVKQLTDWAVNRGIVRHEISLKAMFLSRYGLDQPSQWTADIAIKLMSTYRTHDRAGFSGSSYDQIANDLIAKGVPSGRAQKAQLAAYSFLAGHQFIIGHNITRSAYYRLQQDLRKVNINIGAPLNIAAMRHTIRVVEWRTAEPPSFYQKVG